MSAEDSYPSQVVPGSFAYEPSPPPERRSPSPEVIGREDIDSLVKEPSSAFTDFTPPPQIPSAPVEEIAPPVPAPPAYDIPKMDALSDFDPINRQAAKEKKPAASSASAEMKDLLKWVDVKKS